MLTKCFCNAVTASVATLQEPSTIEEPVETLDEEPSSPVSILERPQSVASTIGETAATPIQRCQTVASSPVAQRPAGARKRLSPALSVKPCSCLLLIYHCVII